MGSYYLLLIVISGASMWVSGTLKRKFKKYSKIQLRSNMSGKEIAEKMLFDHGIKDVKIISVRGSLTDHYNPQKKTINLSESVFNECNAASAAVAAHARTTLDAHGRASRRRVPTRSAIFTGKDTMGIHVE